MSLKDYLPGDKKNNKTIKVNHPKDHPDVQNIADKKYDKMKKKIFGGVGMLGDNIKKSRKMDAKATKEAKKFMDTVQTMKSKKMSASEGSFSKGGLHQGYGAARTSGMGLQDEKLNPGKIYKAKRGSGLDLPVINSVKPTVNKTKRAQNLSRMKIQFTKQKNRAGANPNSHFDKKNANVVKHTRVSGSPVASKFTERRMKLAGPFSSMAEMRKAKGFKPGESASEFNKRRTALAGATKALKATKVGKIALGVGAAGVAAQQYLKSKMNKKDEPEKKMSGGMMKKYSEGMSYKDMAPYGGKYAKIKKNMSDEASENVKRLTTQSDAYDPETRYVTASQRKGNSRRRRTTKTTDQVYLKGVANKMKEDMGSGTSTSILTPSQARERRIIRPKRRRALSSSATLSRIKERPDRPTGSQKELLDRRPPRKISSFNMGGMMQKPMGYKHGTSVTASCKLGRNKPTKIT